jgi:undecaprenyl-diphosphatase
VTNILQVILLGLIQGLTEFLPISSSAHLIFIPNLFGWEQRGLAFDIATHLGTLTAVLFYYREDLLKIIKDSLQFKNSPYSKLGIYITLATIPVGLVGILCEGLIDKYLRSDVVIAISTIIFGIVLYLADKYNKKNQANAKLNIFNCLFVGLAQILALIPGASRSGVTLSAGLFAKLDRHTAAKFSFLLSIPVIGMAGGLQIYKLFFHGLTINLLEIVIGFSVAAISGYCCINVFLKLLQRIGLTPFVIYRIILGIMLLTFMQVYR